MRIALAVIALCALSAPPAGALPAVHAGGDAGLLLRQEAGGNRSVLPALSLRALMPAALGVEVGPAATFAYASGGGAIASATTQHWRLALRAERSWTIRKAEAIAAVAPVLVFMRTGLLDRGKEIRSVLVSRPGAAAGVALQVPFGRFAVRTGADLVVTSTRLDFAFTLGATWRPEAAP